MDVATRQRLLKLQCQVDGWILMLEKFDSGKHTGDRKTYLGELYLLQAHLNDNLLAGAEEQFKRIVDRSKSIVSEELKNLSKN